MALGEPIGYAARLTMNNTGLYDRIDPNRDVEYQTNEKTALIDVTIHLKKKVASSANP